MAEQTGFAITFKQRDEYVKDLKEELIAKIGKAQAILLLQRVPRQLVKKRKLNPKNPKSPEFKYIPHAYVTEILNLATGLNWDLIVTSQERIADQAIVHGYIEVRFGDAVIKKHASGGMRYIAANANMTWADAFNGATSRMLRAAAARLGIGLELYKMEDDMVDAVEDQKPAKQEVILEDDAEPATASQIATLKSLGQKDGLEEMTKGEARAKIKELSTTK